MKVNYNYDVEADAVNIEVGAKKSDITLEWGEHILIDITNDWKLVGLEIMDASVEISKLFNRTLSKNEMKNLLCDIKKDSSNEYLVQFKSSKRNESANLLFPLYKSPLIA
jgi:uncharacterized protein YuzE